MMDLTPHSSNSRVSVPVTVFAILVCAWIVRGSVLLFTPGALTADPDGYRLLAVNLLEHGVFGHGDTPSAYRPPLYPLALVPCVALGEWSRVAIGLLHLAIGLATVWLTYRLGQRWGLGLYSLVAAVLVAFDPILLNQSTLVMTETLAALLAVAGLYGLTLAAQRPSPGWAAAAGGVLGLAVLCRPTFLILAALAAVLVPWFAATWRRRLEVFGALTAMIVLVLAPWVIRNQLQFGRPITSTTHGGYTLLLANNPDFYAYLRSGKWGTIWDAERFNADWAARASLGGPAAELANDRRAYGEAWEHIARQPGMFLYACAVRLGRTWQLLPHQTHPAETALARGARFGIATWYLGELALALVGFVGLLRLSAPGRAVKSEPGRAGPIPGRHAPALSDSHAPARTWRYAPAQTWKRLAQTWLWGLLLVLSFTAVHTVYWTNMRMRAPLMPVVALAAAAAVGRIAGNVSCRNSLPDKQLGV